MYLAMVESVKTKSKNTKSYRLKFAGDDYIEDLSLKKLMALERAYGVVDDKEAEKCRAEHRAKAAAATARGEGGGKRKELNEGTGSSGEPGEAHQARAGGETGKGGERAGAPQADGEINAYQKDGTSRIQQGHARQPHRTVGDTHTSLAIGVNAYVVRLAEEHGQAQKSIGVLRSERLGGGSSGGGRRPSAERDRIERQQGGREWRGTQSTKRGDKRRKGMAAGEGGSAEQNEQQRSEEDGSETHIIGGNSSTAPANEAARRSIDAGDKRKQNEQQQSDEDGSEKQIVGGDSSAAPAEEAARRSIDAGDKRRRGETAGDGESADQNEQQQSDEDGSETQIIGGDSSTAPPRARVSESCLVLVLVCGARLQPQQRNSPAGSGPALE